MVLTLHNAATGHDTPHTVLCGFGCGYLAHSETDLDEHETDCDHADSDQEVSHR